MGNIEKRKESSYPDIPFHSSDTKLIHLLIIITFKYFLPSNKNNPSKEIVKILNKTVTI
jgi:hypothetical protein